jgi:hypothetical protein
MLALLTSRQCRSCSVDFDVSRCCSLCDMATPKKPVSKKSVPTPKATGKAVSAAKVRNMNQENVKYYDAMLDSTGDVLDYGEGHKLYKKAANVIDTYYIGDRGQKPTQRQANALSRDYNILMKAVDANKKAPVKGKAPMDKKPVTPLKKKK